MSNTHRNADGKLVADEGWEMPLEGTLNPVTFGTVNATTFVGSGASLTGVALPTSANGSFTTADLKTVTVVNGIITSIV